MFSTFNSSLLYDDFREEILTLYIGPKHKNITIHEKLLFSKSNYFRQLIECMRGEYEEGNRNYLKEENRYYLKDEDPAAFEVLRGWLYRGMIRVIVPPTIPAFLPSIGGHIMSQPPFIFLGSASAKEPLFNSVTPPTVTSTGLLSTTTTTLFNSPTTPDFLNTQPLTSNPIIKAEPIKTTASPPLPSSPSQAAKSPSLPLHKTNTDVSHAKPSISPQLAQSLTDAQTHQLALLNLTIFADKAHWPALYNESINAYLRGETILNRKVPHMHVALIYRQTRPSCTLRDVVRKSLARGEGSCDYASYADVLKDVDNGFALDLLKVLEGLVKENVRGGVWVGGLSAHVLEFYMKEE